MNLNKYQELEEAARAILKHLTLSDEVKAINAMYLSPADQLRVEANRIQQKDAAIYRLRQALLNLK